MTGTAIQIKSPFPWFGGKLPVASLVWERLGNVPNFVEPFFGSGAVLLNRPHAPKIETINDKDGFLSNFWRAVQADPDGVTQHADWPVNENDLHARHSWLVAHKDKLQAQVEGDPDYYDAKIAGWWVWGICSWIGSGWCSGNGPWQSVDGLLVNTTEAGRGVKRQRTHLGNAGQGINRKRPHLMSSKGINRANTHLGNVFAELQDRLRNVRVCCGDWTRVLGDSPTSKLGVTGVFLDPPYSHSVRDATLYRQEMEIATAVRDYCIERGDDPNMRIALCGYEGEHTMPENWDCIPWKAKGGYGSQGEGAGKANAHRERIWFSPYCLKTELF